MLSLDISRESFQRSKNYSGLRQQHGRVINESELNEGSDIAAEELRRAIQDVICNSGTPDDGFRVSFAGPGIPAGYDFLLDRGSYYIGGRRYDCFGSTFLTQPDWLQHAADIVSRDLELPGRIGSREAGPCHLQELPLSDTQLQLTVLCIHKAILQR